MVELVRYTPVGLLKPSFNTQVIGPYVAGFLYILFFHFRIPNSPHLGCKDYDRRMIGDELNGFAERCHTTENEERVSYLLYIFPRFLEPDDG